MRKTTIAILLVLATATSLLLAQAPPQPPDPAARAEHRVGFLATLLSLTSAQQQQATTIFTNAGTAETALHKNMKTARDTLFTAVKNNDAAGIEQAATTIGNLTAQLTSAEAKADAAFYQILTPEQQTKLTQFESQRQGPGFRGMGPGFGPGPGPR